MRVGLVCHDGHADPLGAWAARVAMHAALGLPLREGHVVGDVRGGDGDGDGDGKSAQLFKEV